MVDVLVLVLRALLVASGGPAARTLFALVGAVLVVKYLLGSGKRGAR